MLPLFRLRIPRCFSDGRPRKRVVLALAVSLLSWAGGAGAVLIATGDGTGNTTPPSSDPGFANVGATSRS